MKDQILKKLQNEIALLDRELHSDLPKEIRRARELVAETPGAFMPQSP